MTPGASVLIQGTGGGAVLALQFALAAGADVWLISSSEEKLERAGKLGAQHLLNYKQTPEWGAAIVEQTGGRGVDTASSAAIAIPLKRWSARSPRMRSAL